MLGQNQVTCETSRVSYPPLPRACFVRETVVASVEPNGTDLAGTLGHAAYPAAPAPKASPFMSDEAMRIADFLIRRGNERSRTRADRDRGRFDENYGHIVALAMNKYPAPMPTVFPDWCFQGSLD